MKFKVDDDPGLLSAPGKLAAVIWGTDEDY
jgi:hypothetical protein